MPHGGRRGTRRRRAVVLRFSCADAPLPGVGRRLHTTHRLQHAFPRVYSWTHAHHQHRAPSLTNSSSRGSTVARGLLPSPSRRRSSWRGLPHHGRAHYYMACVQWYQIGSHNARTSCASRRCRRGAAVQPHAAQGLRPDGLRDHRHVRFHAAHHRAVKGNYGIRLDGLAARHGGAATPRPRAADASLCDAAAHQVSLYLMDRVPRRRPRIDDARRRLATHDEHQQFQSCTATICSFLYVLWLLLPRLSSTWRSARREAEERLVRWMRGRGGVRRPRRLGVARGIISVNAAHRDC